MAKEKKVVKKIPRFSYIFLNKTILRKRNFFPRFSLFSKTSAGGDQGWVGGVGGVGGRKQNKHTASGMTDLHDIRTYHSPKIRKNLGKKFIPHFPYFLSKIEFFRDGKFGEKILGLGGAVVHALVSESRGSWFET